MKQKQMTKTAAIALSRENVGELYRFGNQYRYNYYDAKANAWRESIATEYFQALFSRSQSLIYEASRLLNGEERALESMESYLSGPWTESI